jgi:putative transcriptional regulator
MAAYICVLIGVVASRPHEGAASYLELLPAIPLFLALWAILRQYKRFDEFYQRIHSEAFALGAYTLGPMPTYHYSTLQMKNALKELCNVKSWSQQGLAKQLDVSRQSVIAIEREKYDPSLGLAFKITRLFNTQMETFFFPEA